MSIATIGSDATHCTLCEGHLPNPHVVDNDSGARFCGRWCAHEDVYGIRQPLTMAEADSKARAKAWHAKYDAPWRTGE